MSEFGPAFVLLGVVVAAVLASYSVARMVVVAPPVVEVVPFSGGLVPAEHAVSRFHVRWYAVTMVFLAFDMEMIFMYPWTLVVSRVGPSSVIEMFLFLAILLAGVIYAWREGALRWA
ncbi:NADH-quinone oxidoreductase subunit A [Pseudonocardia sp. KRD291]|uniref:NADH-quinone oxidoreductase subunit A n=1 Tax=Pseudonocardia sp. KRD291 TaxID=2792007 RepID=UPI001C4A517F|nr:NADH-quinone oxidoreductase subunit A [Pseudonocardia sp. KRD291]MBW0107107.1 NADH-quinone oxidoreductase subunit A [Pseudonocardia sp. KRD291]